jgi:hypothetical protein
MLSPRPVTLLSSILLLLLSTCQAKTNSPRHLSQRQNSDTLPSFTADQLYALQVRLWETFLSPADQVQAEAINSTLLSEDCQGRIDITRTFDGRELNTEYLFGLFANLAANPNQTSLIGVPLSYEIIHFAANENIASAATRFQFNLTSLGLVIPVESDTWINYNEKGEITQYDATFKYWTWLMDYVVGTM